MAGNYAFKYKVRDNLYFDRMKKAYDQRSATKPRREKDMDTDKCNALIPGKVKALALVAGE